jgi:hypothetical protein
LRVRVCCIITSEVENCCLKYKSRGVNHGFYISSNISISRYKNANKSIILILQSGKYKVDIRPLRESNMCLHVTGSACTPHYLIICSRSVLYFLHVFRSEIKCTHVYIQFWRFFSLIKFQSRKINSVFSWLGVTRKSLASFLKSLILYCFTSRSSWLPCIFLLHH